MAATSGRRCTLRKDKKTERPAIHSLALPLLMKIPFSIFLSLFGAVLFARYSSGSNDVTAMTVYTWCTIDWCYISTPGLHIQLATVLLANRPVAGLGT